MHKETTTPPRAELNLYETPVIVSYIPVSLLSVMRYMNVFTKARKDKSLYCLFATLWLSCLVQWRNLGEGTSLTKEQALT